MDLNLSDYIKHPERLDKETLPHLCRLVDAYPYFQPARLLYLRNLYQLHDAAFDRELRRAAYYLPDRRALFQLIEGVNYRLEPVKKRQPKSEDVKEDRTYSLIDSFLANLPEEKPQRPKPVDASTDYMAYLMQSEEAPDTITAVPRMQYRAEPGTGRGAAGAGPCGGGRNGRGRRLFYGDFGQNLYQTRAIY